MTQRTLHITWQMYDCMAEREFTRGNEIVCNTIAQAQKWIRDELAKRDKDSLCVDAVFLSEKGGFHDSEGEPCDSKLLGTFEPQDGEWRWEADT